MSRPLIGSPEWLRTHQLSSELLEAGYALHDGDGWPYAVLSYRTGHPGPLAALIARGAQPSPEATELIASIVRGSFRRTKADTREEIEKKFRVLHAISLHRIVLDAWKLEPASFGGAAGCIDSKGRRFTSIEQIYSFVADDLCLGEDAVAQIAKRNRRRVRAGGQ